MKLLNRQVEHRYLDALAIIFAVVLIAGSIFGYTRFLAVETAKREFALKQKTAAATIAEFDRIMGDRDSFLAVAARVDLNLASVAGKVTNSIAQKEAWDKDAAAMVASYTAEAAAVKAHNDAENAKYKSDPRYTTRDYWTLPSNPGTPAAISVEFSAETAAVIAAAAEVETFRAELKKTEAGYKNNESKTIFKNLYKSVEALESALERDAVILGNLVTTGKQGQFVNEAKADLIQYNAEDEWLKACRSKAVDFIKDHNLDLVDYDVPGGSDANPQDKSLL